MQPKVSINADLMKVLIVKGTVSNDIKDYSDDPFFIKKAAAAKKKVDRAGFPKAFLSKNR